MPTLEKGSEKLQCVSLTSPETRAQQEPEPLSSPSSGTAEIDDDARVTGHDEIEASLAAGASLDAVTDLLEEKEREISRLRAQLAQLAGTIPGTIPAAPPAAPPAAARQELLPHAISPWAVAVQQFVNGYLGNDHIDGDQHAKLLTCLKNETLFTPELSKGPDAHNFPIRWKGPKQLFEEAKKLGNPDAFARKVWMKVPTWVKLLIRRHEIENGAILIQPCSISRKLRMQMGIRNVDGFYDPPKSMMKQIQVPEGKSAGEMMEIKHLGRNCLIEIPLGAVAGQTCDVFVPSGKKPKFVAKLGHLVESARGFEASLKRKGGANACFMVLFDGEPEPVELVGEDISYVDPNKWFVGLLEDFPFSPVYHELVAEQKGETDRMIDDLRRKNERKLVGPTAHLNFAMDDAYNTTSKLAKDGKTEAKLEELKSQYEALANEVAEASDKARGAAKDRQFEFYRKDLWPTIRGDFLRDPSPQAELPDPGDYAGLISILPSGDLVEPTALTMCHFLAHSPGLKLALFFSSAPPKGQKGLPSADSPLAGRVYVKPQKDKAARWGLGKLANDTSQAFEKSMSSKSSAGEKAEYKVLLFDQEGILEQTAVAVKGADIELQRIPDPMRRLQELIPKLDDSAIASSVELYWHERKGKAIMRGQLIEDEMDEVSAASF
jgi:hypothetical protein